MVVKAPMVDSGAILPDGREACVPLDLTEKFESQPTVAQLTNMAQSVMASQQSYLPAQTVKVSFIRLQDTEEYKEYAPLMECRLCDTINVVFPRYNMSGSFKIVKTVYNVLTERYEEMELGTLSTSLSEALGISGDSDLINSTSPVKPAIYTESLTASVSVAGSGEGHTNLKTLIDADMPNGSTCLGIVGFTTNNQNVIPVSIRYVDGAYSLQLRNLSSAATTASVAIYYIYI